MNTATEEQVRGDAAVETMLHIFVNRRKFGTEQGVQEIMTGREIAALVEVPADNAVVRRESGPDQREIGIDESVTIKTGEHFLVTRRTVEGGHGA
jgi:Multiubiquitin